MLTTPIKRHQPARPGPAGIPSDPEDSRGQMKHLTSPELRDILACSPKDKRAAVSFGYRGNLPKRAPLTAARSESSLFPSASSSATPPSTIFSSASDTRNTVYQSPQRGLQPMYDIMNSTDPWSSPDRSKALDHHASSQPSSTFWQGSSQLEYGMGNISRVGKRGPNDEENDQTDGEAASMAFLDEENVQNTGDGISGMQVDLKGSKTALPVDCQDNSSSCWPILPAAISSRPLRGIPLRINGRGRAGAGLQHTQSLPASMFRMDAEF